MRKLRCCVIDDEPLALEFIKSYVEKTPFLELVDAFPSASMAVRTIIGSDIDLLFLDIQMDELNGIEFARVVPSKCCIVFGKQYIPISDSYKNEFSEYIARNTLSTAKEE